MSDTARNDSTSRQFTSGAERKQAEVFKCYEAARRTEQKSRRQEDRAAAIRRAANTIHGEGGRNL